MRAAQPKLFVQGERDEICPLVHMRAFFAELPEPKQLVVVPGANHLFTGRVEEVGRAITTMLGERRDAPSRLSGE